MIDVALFKNPKFEYRNPKQIRTANISKRAEALDFVIDSCLFRAATFGFRISANERLFRLLRIKVLSEHQIGMCL
jgi:hypothetical protein